MVDPARKRGEPPNTGFAPIDYTDSRSLGDWQSRYEKEARREIRIEASYLAILAVGSLTSAAFTVIPGAGPEDVGSASGSNYLAAILCGVLGGTLFAIKWLYHSVAKGLWNLDRRLWRLLSPILSGGLAFGVVILVESGLFGVFNEGFLRPPVRAGALGFLVGYFSDNALAKLTEIAKSIFGIAAAERVGQAKRGTGEDR